MARITKDRVRESTSTTGTGPWTVAGAPANYQSFASVCSVSDTFEGTMILAGSQWQSGLFTYSGANQITLTTHYESSTGSAVSFSAGSKEIWIGLPASIGAKITRVEGNCYLTVSGNELKLNRHDGRHIFINGTLEEIPSTPPALVATGITTTGGVSSGPMYYIYAYISGGVVTLERSTTAYAVDATYGHKIKSGDATRTLVGIWSASANDTWSTVATEGASWFNARPKTYETATNNPATTTTGALAALSGANAAPFVTFSDREVTAVVKCSLNCSTATASMFLNLGLDGGTTGQLDATRDYRNASTSDYTPMYESLQETFAEGAHTLTPIGYTSAGTVNYGLLGTRVSILG